MPLNLEKLAYELLIRTLPDIAIMPELDVESLDISNLPAVTFMVSGGEAIATGPGKPTAWDVTLTLNLFHDDLDGAIALSGRVYDGVWEWDDPWSGAGIIADLGHVAEIGDQAIFTRVGSADVGDRTLTHMSGAFSMQMHQA